MIKYVLIFSVFLFACSKRNKVIDGNQFDVSAKITNNWKASNERNYTIKNATINKDCLIITIQSGGCDGKSWTIAVEGSNSIIKTLPAIRPVQLILENKEKCYALITKTYYVNIKPFRDDGSSKSIYLSLEGWSKNLLYSY